MFVFDMTHILHVPGYVILPAALVAGTLAGVLNGVLIVFAQLQPFIATLATLAAYRGFVYAISGRQLVPGLTTTPITDPWIAGIETYFDLGGDLGPHEVHCIPRGFRCRSRSCWALLAVFQNEWPSPTRFGRDLYTPGRQRRGGSSRRRQHGTNNRRCLCYRRILAPAVAALIMVARFTTSTEALGTGMELSAIAAAVIGGVSLLTGGIGSMFGPALGAFLLGAVLLRLTLHGRTVFVQQVLTGAILLAAVGYDRLNGLETQRRLTANLAGPPEMAEHLSSAAICLIKVYGHLVALREANLTVMPGEARGLIGSNGAGKSTLVRNSTGAVAPTRGAVESRAKPRPSATPRK